MDDPSSCSLIKLLSNERIIDRLPYQSLFILTRVILCSYLIPILCSYLLISQKINYYILLLLISGSVLERWML